MSIEIPTWPKINNALGSTTTEFGASDWANLISDYYNGTNLSLVDATKLPIIGSLTRYKFEKLGLFDVDQSHSIIFSVDDIDTGAQRKIKFRRMNAPFVEDYAVLEGLSQTIINKNISGSTNTLSNIPYSSLTGAPTSMTPNTHATSHKSGGSDAIKLDELGTPTDVTTLNATTGLHGLLKKLSNSASQYMDGTGNWSVPQGVPGVINTLTDVDTVTAAPTNNQVLTWNSTSSQWVPATPPGSAGGEANTTSNTGTGEGTLALAKSGVNLPFKSLKQGTNITLTNNANDVTITASTGATNLDALTDVVITSPASQQLVYYNGTNFINSTSTPFKNGLYLYHIYIDAADSKFKALNLDTLAIEFTSSGTTDALAVFNSVIAAASTAKRPIFVDKGKYLFSAQLDVSGKWLKIVGTRIGGNAGGQANYTNETVLKKAYTDNTNPFIKWDNSSTYTKQQWERITIEGKDTGDNGTGSDFDNGGIGMYIKGANECYEAFKDVMICHFGTGLKLETVWQFNYYGTCFYSNGVGMELTWDGVTESTKCFCNYFYGGEFRLCSVTDVLITNANDTAFFGTMIEGMLAQTGNVIKLTSRAANTRLYGVSFESPVQSQEIIEDAGYGLLVSGGRFGGNIWTAQTIYRAKSTADACHFVGNVIEPYTNNAIATILLDSGSSNMVIKHNSVILSATNTSLVITDNSGNSITNDIGPNMSGATNLGSVMGPTTKFLSVPTVELTTATDYNVKDLLILYRKENADFLYNGISFDGLSSTGVRRTYASMFTSMEDTTNAAEYSYYGFNYIFAGTLARRAYFKDNGVHIGPDGTKFSVFNTALTADRTFTLPDKSGKISINIPTFVRKGATANRRYVAGLRQNADTALLTSTTAPAVNTLWAMPLLVTEPTKFDTITCQVTTLGSGSNVRMGIYADDGTGSYPGSLIYDSGSISSATTGAKENTITAGVQLFQPGIYWIAFECSATAPQIRILPGVGNYIAFGGYDNTLSTTPPQFAWSVAHTLGALPNPYTASATAITTASSVSTPIPAVGLRSIT